jgi:uncharacterized repeat protein (TIGR01451 family)
MKLTTNLSFLLILFTVTITLSQSNKALKPINETISFEENKGQMKDQNWKSRPDVLYSGSSEGMNFFIRNSGISYQLSRVESWKEEEEEDMLHASLGSDDKKRQVPDQIGTYRVDAEWLNANQDFSINKGTALEGYNNYYNVPEGVEPALFVKKYESLTLKNVWNGVDIHYYGNGGFLETDYIVAPGADYRQIQIDIKGAELSTDDQGNLIIKTPFGEIREGQLKVYQNDVLIEASWKIEGNRVSFDIPNYNPNIAMVIDPLTRVWGTYYGGAGDDIAKYIKINHNNKLLVSGDTESINSISSNGFQNTLNGSSDVYLAQFDLNGTRLWGTYFGGNNTESLSSFDINTLDEIILLGQTSSTTNISINAFQANLAGSSDLFITKINDLGQVVWSTYFGGTGGDGMSTSNGGQSITINGSNEIFFTGTTLSINLPISNAHQSTYGGGKDAFIAKLTNNGNLVWSSYYGGNDIDNGNNIGCDNLGNVYLSGYTFSSNNISFQGYKNFLSGPDAFLVKFNNQGVRQWGTYFGGSNYESGRTLAIDNSNNIYLGGITHSGNGIAYFGHQNFNGGDTLINNIDLFLSKFSTNGQLVWSTFYGGTGTEMPCGMTIDNFNKIYLIGKTTSNNNISANGFVNNNDSLWSDFFVKFDDNGIRYWGSYFNQSSNQSFSGGTIAIDQFYNLYLSGATKNQTDISTVNCHQYFFGGLTDGYIVKFNQPKISGLIWNDLNANCIKDINEYGVNGISLTINPGNNIIQSYNNGVWELDSLPIGNYTATIDTTNLNWTPTCPITQSFQITNSNSFSQGPSFGLLNTIPCSSPEITIFAPFLRRCFSNQIVYVQACNDNAASVPLDSSFVVVTLDTLLTVNSASLPFTALGNNTYQFQTGTLNPGQCVNFTLSTTVSCNATLGQTLCMNAELFPVDGCVLDSIPSGPNWDSIPSEGALGGLPQPCLGPWDQSSLSVNGWCQNDSIYFTVTNTGVLGGGDMECYAPVWLTVNGVVTFTDSIMLQGGQTLTYAFAGNGQTWILNASQHPLHPGNSQPNAFVERCGNAANWTPGEVNDYPQDDADPVIDIYCEEVSGSYDPNDKRGYPNGVTNMNYIQPNQQLQYVIRFQNTGTDTAFTVVIRDTLDLDLNIFTVTPGVSSHNYEFRMYGPRVLEWRFDNILLPDSTTNSVGSNGFVTFHVEQNPNLSPGTVITNDADIYFDYNDPITTNTTIHRIYEGFPNVLSLQDLVNSKESIVLFPNPTSSEITITSDKFTNEPYTLYDQMGRTVSSGKLSGTNTTISLSTLSKGIYILKVEGDYESAIVVKE